MEKNKIPYISRGSYIGLVNALTSGIFSDLDRIILHTVTSGDEHLNDLCIVFPEDKSIHWVGNSDLSQIVNLLSNNVDEVTGKVDKLGSVEVNGESATITQYVENTIQNNSRIAWEEF